MDQRSTPEFILEAFADPTSVRDVVRGILHTIFFNRFFPSILPQTRDVLDLTLPHVADVELETMIDQRTAALMRQLDADRNQPHHHHGQQHSNNGSGRGQIVVQFYERRRRKTSGWYPLGRGGEEEVCWESWTVKVTVAEPRTESERAKVRKAMESTLLATVMKIVTYVNTHKDHIPPITTTESNPFPYQIHINQKEAGWATRMGIY
ncbi:DUF1649-domain-containing protein [Coniochaeta ligniaria NRRL 30616]|uniref:Autophagy-related protein 101 n=1 Tax=Coniochaeta ligniaria NRRL 30616 TaxID=1408157 RepID=A0A1J7J1U9_9PEZI|nr:DUF1649-domain-containing protein [Coniochaeta ligniaria NRRL 30616]